MSQSALVAAAGIKMVDINVASECAECHGWLPCSIVAWSGDFDAPVVLKQDGRHAPERYKETISCKDAGLIHMWSFIID